jgi:hypothetical protein
MFLLFIAGFSTKGPMENEELLRILRIIESHSYGGSMQSVRRLPETMLRNRGW